MIKVVFERDIEKKIVTTSLERNVDSVTTEDEEAWGKLALDYASRIADKYTFELNPHREEPKAEITIEVNHTHHGREVDIIHYATEGQDTIGGMTSATLSLSSVVYSMLSEARANVGRQVDDEDFDDFEEDMDDPSFEFTEDNIPDEFND